MWNRERHTGHILSFQNWGISFYGWLSNSAAHFKYSYLGWDVRYEALGFSNYQAPVCSLYFPWTWASDCPFHEAPCQVRLSSGQTGLLWGCTIPSAQGCSRKGMWHVCRASVVLGPFIPKGDDPTGLVFGRTQYRIPCPLSPRRCSDFNDPPPSWAAHWAKSITRDTDSDCKLTLLVRSHLNDPPQCSGSHTDLLSNVSL